VRKLTFLSDGQTITGGVCHGCGNKFIVSPGVDEDEAVRREILNQFGEHKCVRSQGPSPRRLKRLSRKMTSARPAR